MKSTTTALEKLIEKSGIYVETTVELCKNEATYKLADAFSILAVKLVIATVAVVFILFFLIGLALLIGNEFEETYYGFFIVAFGGFCLTILIYIFREVWIKIPASNFIIMKMKKIV